MRADEVLEEHLLSASCVCEENDDDEDDGKDEKGEKEEEGGWISCR